MTSQPTAEMRRIFEAQRAHQREVKASGAAERKTKLARLKAAVEARADAIVAAVQSDTHKPEHEIRVTEVKGVAGNIQRNIDALDEWMKPTEITPLARSGRSRCSRAMAWAATTDISASRPSVMNGPYTSTASGPGPSHIGTAPALPSQTNC